MTTEIGPTLREARMRRKIDLTEVEGATKIRARYLRALENEEWDVLPEGPYVRSFIRTYAAYLGLDGERLAEEYRRGHEEALEERHPRPEPPVAPAVGPGRGGRVRFGRGTLAVAISVGLVALLIVLGLTGGSGNGGAPNGAGLVKQGKGNGKHRGHKKHRASAKQSVELKLTAIADVWVCLVDSQGSPVLNGQIIPAGAKEGPYHSSKFAVRFGNGSVAMQVNGHEAQIAASSSPVGYEVTASGVQSLPDSAQPTCA